MSNCLFCLFLVGNNLFNHSSSVQRLFWRCLDVCNVYLFLVKSRGAEEPNKTFANINKFNLYPCAYLALSDVFDYTKAHKQSWPELKLYAGPCLIFSFVFD